MKKRLTAALTVLVVVTSASLLQAAPLKDSPYYPLAVGTEWVYKLTAGGKVQTLTVKVTKHEMVNGVMCARVETFSGNRSLASEHIMVKADGIYRVKSLKYLAKPPLRILKLPVKKGDTWQINSLVAGQILKGQYSLTQETMTVPAGVYKNAAVVKSPNLRVGPMTWNYKGVFVKGVGLIYQKIITGGRVFMIQELKEYKPAKK